MRFEERKITLRDGRTCVLRPTVPEDSEAMLEYLMQVATETPFLLRYPDEIKYTVETERTFLRSMLEDEQRVMMVAIVDGNVAGNCSLIGIGSARRECHRTSFAIALKKEYWALGIGTAMTDFCIELGRRAGYEQIELEVVEGNDSAKHVYEKCGFVETGRHVRALKYDDGTYRDEFIMIRRLV